MAQVVLRDVRQMLDLSDDVVPEVADHATVQRGQIGEVW